MQWWSSRSSIASIPKSRDVNQHPVPTSPVVNELPSLPHPAGPGISSHRFADPCTDWNDRRAASCVGGPVAAFPVAGPCLKRNAKAQKPRYGPAVPATCQRRSEPGGNARVPSLPSGYTARKASLTLTSLRDRVDHAGVALKQDLPGNPLGPQLPHVNLGIRGAWVACDSDADRDVDAAVNRRDPIVPQA